MANDWFETVAEAQRRAKKRLPKIAYDFIEGGTDDEVALTTNEQAFRQARIVPRYLVDVTVRDQSTTLFGRTYSSPIGIAPTGSSAPDMAVVSSGHTSWVTD